MLDPIFADGLVDKALRVDEQAPAPPRIEPVKSTTLGAERFVHSANILGHDIAVTSNRVVGGRMASGGHSKPTTFSNVHEQVTAMEVARWRAGMAKSAAAGR
mmetsp:Transcript_2395/g.5236  ORF Transcript_2395/g.5236 Transcript_2395/m.5236 type:complete len:102 (+) Transcript_2395:619-924(+)